MPSRGEIQFLVFTFLNQRLFLVFVCRLPDRLATGVDPPIPCLPKPRLADTFVCRMTKIASHGTKRTLAVRSKTVRRASWTCQIVCRVTCAPRKFDLMNRGTGKAASPAAKFKATTGRLRFRASGRVPEEWLAHIPTGIPRSPFVRVTGTSTPAWMTALRFHRRSV